MLYEIAGVKKVNRLYVQLLYYCNFRCQHCFQGKNLKSREEFSLTEVKNLILHFKQKYQTETVVLLGGEPFLYKSLKEVCRFVKSNDLSLEIVTNGYHVNEPLVEISDCISKLRVSIEGLQKTNDRIRRKGSFQAALDTLDLANKLNIPTSVTLTLNSQNLNEVFQLFDLLINYGVGEIKIHPMRNVGNVTQHQYLIIQDSSISDRLFEEIQLKTSCLPIAVVIDRGRNLDPHWLFDNGERQQLFEELDRIEIQPSGEVYSSCMVVGTDSNSLYYDRLGTIIRLKS